MQQGAPAEELKPAEIIEAAKRRQEELLQQVHDDAVAKIKQRKERNEEELRQEKAVLKSQLEERKVEVKAETEKIVAELEKNSEKYMGDLVDLLYNAVITIEDA